MKTKRLTLRNVEITDAKLLAQWKNDPYPQEMSTGEKEFTTETEQTDITNNHDPYYILVINETNEPIGYIRINWLDEHANCAWLRFGLGSHRGQGYMKEALETLILTLFEQGVHRIESEICAYNTSSQKLLKSLNFQHEGTRRQAYYQNGTYHDVHLFGRIKRIPSTNLQDYLTYVIPYYPQPESLNSILKNLNFFDTKTLNLSKLYFLATFSGLITKLQTDSKFMAQTLSKLASLNWDADQIKDALYSLERQLHSPLTEEEKIVHDLYTLEQIGAPEIARALALEGTQHQLFDDIRQNKFEFFTTIGKEIGEERLTYTKKFLQQL